MNLIDLTKRTRHTGGVNWPTTLFLILTPIAGIAGTWYWLASGRFSWATLALFFVTWAITAMGITAGYHRLFAHRSYAARGPLRVALLFAGGAAWEGSCLEWCRDHRRHHRYVDTEQDPYNINQGFWWAHMMWLVRDNREHLDPREVPDLYPDRLMRLQDRYYAWIATATSFFLPWGLATLWGDPWGGLFVAAALRITVNHHATFLINSLCHWAGTQPYSDTHSARDSWFAALLTYGEGYHNFHHEFPSDYRNGVRAHQWDPTKWLIWTSTRLHLAGDLRRVAPERILAKRLRMQEKRLAEKLARAPKGLSTFADGVLASAREQVHAAAERLASLRRQYHARAADLAGLAHSGGVSAGHGAAAIKAQLREMGLRLKAGEKELRAYMAMWKAVAKGVSRMGSA
jgi:stearoyl-CoA desaturase (delta-9 desaturase)